MTEPDDDGERAINRRVARQMIAHFSESQKAAFSEIGSVGRWLMASLLAVNGGGALAALNAAPRLGEAAIEGSLFIGGLLAALASGVFNQKATTEAARVSAEGLGHSLVVEHTGEYHEAAKQFAETMEGRIRRVSWRPPAAGWLSALLFAIGAVTLGMDARSVDKAASPRCAFVQRQMLSPKPSLPNAATAFEALGCHPRD